MTDERRKPIHSRGLAQAYETPLWTEGACAYCTALHHEPILHGLQRSMNNMEMADVYGEQIQQRELNALWRFFLELSIRQLETLAVRSNTPLLSETDTTGHNTSHWPIPYVTRELPLLSEFERSLLTDVPRDAENNVIWMHADTSCSTQHRCKKRPGYSPEVSVLAVYTYQTYIYTHKHII